jgi:integrase
MDRHTLAKLMGHSSPRITEKYYIHVTEPHISAGFERFMVYQAKRLRAFEGAKSREPLTVSAAPVASQDFH